MSGSINQSMNEWMTKLFVEQSLASPGSAKHILLQILIVAISRLDRTYTPIHQGSTNRLSWLSAITETPISQGNFSLEFTFKIPKKGYFWQNKNLSQKQVTVTEKLSMTETNICHRKKVYLTEIIFCQTKISVREKKFPSQKKVSVRVSVREIHLCDWKKFPSQKKVSVSEKKFWHRQKFLSEKKLPSQKQVDKNLIYQDIVLSSSKGKCEEKEKKQFCRHNNILLLWSQIYTIQIYALSRKLSYKKMG